MGGVCNRLGHLLAYARADGIVVGLWRVCRASGYARGGTPTGQSDFHAYRSDGLGDERAVECVDHIAALLDHHGVGGQAYA